MHPTLPYIITCSDDLTIKCFDWDKNWKCVQVFEGHTHYVMQTAFNLKNTNTFASASLDKTIKVWSLGSGTANFTLEGHEKGVNCVNYYYGNDKPYIISGGDDKTIRIWDYTNKNCIRTLTGHNHNVSFAVFLPDLPFIVSGSEDGNVKIWQQNTYRVATNLNYALDRAWSIGYQRNSISLALGFEEGTVVIKLGKDDPVASMDNSGKIIWSKQNEIQSANIKTSLDENIKDGEKIALPIKDLGTCEVYPQTLQHSPNGRFVTVCGDGEFIIYTALAWRSKSFGQGLEFVWAQDSNHYATRTSNHQVQLFKNFKEKKDGIPEFHFTPEQIYGGTLLAVRSSSFILFFDWETGLLVRKIDVAAKNVFWSESGESVAIICDSSFFILRFNRAAFNQFIEAGNDVGVEGVEDAFEVTAEISENISTAKWIGDCFLYTSSLGRLNYIIGDEVNTVAHFDKPNYYLLGYIPRDSRVYLIDKEFNIVSYALSLTVLDYQTLILRGDLEAAEALLPQIPEQHHNKVARFLESQGLRELALSISNDVDHKFDLALALNNLEVALDIAKQVDNETKWRIVGDQALNAWNIDVAEECLKKANDYSGLLLLYSSTGNKAALEELLESSKSAGQNNVAMVCSLLTQQTDKSISLLTETNRLPEAALYARTYAPEKISPLVQKWKSSLDAKKQPKAAEALADPQQYPNLFPQLTNNGTVEESAQVNEESQPEENTEGTQNQVNGNINSVSPTTLSPATSSRRGTGKEEIDDVSSLADDTISDNQSHISMEVNTTGTGSIKV